MYNSQFVHNFSTLSKIFFKHLLSLLALAWVQGRFFAAPRSKMRKMKMGIYTLPRFRYFFVAPGTLFLLLSLHYLFFNKKKKEIWQIQQVLKMSSPLNRAVALVILFVCSPKYLDFVFSFASVIRFFLRELMGEGSKFENRSETFFFFFFFASVVVQLFVSGLRLPAAFSLDGVHLLSFRTAEEEQRKRMPLYTLRWYFVFPPHTLPNRKVYCTVGTVLH